MDGAAEEDKGTVKLANQLCAGRVSYDCDCGRHQYWYRYIATAGNFALAPPKEYAYPKVRKPDLEGVACKHVIHAMTRLQSASWQLTIGKALAKAAKQVAFGDDRRRTTEHFSDEQQKVFNRNRNSRTDAAAMKREWAMYQRRQQALGEQLNRGSNKLDALRKQLTKARKMSDSQKRRMAEKEQQLVDERAKNKLLSQRLADQVAQKKQTFVDALVMTGMSRKEAEKKFIEYAKNGGK
ncbi:hypothetical protein ACX5DB_003893 [Enterobacter ludwigii]